MSTIFLNTHNEGYPSVMAITNDLTVDQWPICSKVLAEYKRVGISGMFINEKLETLQLLMNSLVDNGHEIKEW